MIPEIQKVREKYPVYNDKTDLEIARGLAKKYPDAYGHLPNKVISETARAASETPNTDNMSERMEQNPNLAGAMGAGKEVLRTGIEAGATTAGEAVGAFIPLPGSAYAGGGIGYAVGKRGAQVIFGEETDNSPEAIAKDVGVGALQAGVGGLLTKIPGVKRIFTKGGKTLENKAYNVAEKSMKVPPSWKGRERAINTLLKERIPISKGGLQRVKGIMDGLNDAMDAAIAKDPGKLINIDDVLGPVNELRSWAAKSVNGKKFVKQIDGVIKGFRAQHGNIITLAEAQKIKQTTNAFLRKSYGELKPVTTEATKQIVRGLKDKIANEIEEIAGINARYADLAVLEKALERAVNRTGNWDWFGLTASVGATTIGATTGSLSSAAEGAALIRLLRSPQVQSRIALVLKRAGAKKDANTLAVAVANAVWDKIVPESEESAENYFDETGSTP